MPGQVFRTCCCCDLRTGVILIALFSLGIAAINIYAGVGAVITLKQLRPEIEEQGNTDKLPIPWKYYDDAIDVGWSNIAFYASDLIIGVILLIGALQRNKCLLKNWIGWTLVCTAYHLCVAIFFLSIWKGVPKFGYAMIFDLLVVVYFLLVVHSFKEEIIQQETNPNLPTTVMVAGQPGYYPAPIMPNAGAYPYPQQQGYSQPVPPPYMYPAGNQAPPPPYAQYQQTQDEQKVPLS